MKIKSKKLLFPIFVFLFVPLTLSVGVAANNEWRLERRSSGNWVPIGEYNEKLDCANRAVDVVTDEDIPENNIRCLNSSTAEIVDWSGIRQAISVGVLPTPSRQCKLETPSLWPIGYWGTFPSLLPCGPNGVNCLECGICGLLMLGQRIIYVMLSALIFIVAPIRFIWAGFLILVSRGSSEQVSRGQKMIYHTVIGLLIGLGAFVIIQTFLWVLGGAGFTDEGLGWPTINCQRNLKP